MGTWSVLLLWGFKQEMEMSSSHLDDLLQLICKVSEKKHLWTFLEGCIRQKPGNKHIMQRYKTLRRDIKTCGLHDIVIFDQNARNGGKKQNSMVCRIIWASKCWDRWKCGICCIEEDRVALWTYVTSGMKSKVIFFLIGLYRSACPSVK